MGRMPFKPGTMQRKVDVVWQLTETRDDGKRHLVFKRYTLSLNEKASLRHDLESWRGKPFTFEELAGFDVEKLIGANCLVNVQHKVGTERTFANVVSVMPLIKGMVKIAPLDYVRPAPKDSDPEPTPAYDAFDHESAITVDDIPF
jgi:hypothetical protein